MNAGIYEYKGNLYLLIGLCRMHEGGAEFVAYVPLRTEPEWQGTARIALRSRADFVARFRWCGERLPP